MFPVTVVVAVLKTTPLMNLIASSLKPFMIWVGLPGEAAIPLTIGSLLNLYAAIGAMIPLNLGSREVTILAAMLLISHNLVVETAVIRGMGAPWGKLLVTRILASFFAGFILRGIL